MTFNFLAKVLAFEPLPALNPSESPNPAAAKNGPRRLPAAAGGGGPAGGRRPPLQGAGGGEEAQVRVPEEPDSLHREDAQEGLVLSLPSYYFFFLLFFLLIKFLFGCLSVKSFVFSFMRMMLEFEAWSSKSCAVVKKTSILI